MPRSPSIKTIKNQTHIHQHLTKLEPKVASLPQPISGVPNLPQPPYWRQRALPRPARAADQRRELRAEDAEAQRARGTERGGVFGAKLFKDWVERQKEDHPLRVFFVLRYFWGGTLIMKKGEPIWAWVQN